MDGRVCSTRWLLGVGEYVVVEARRDEIGRTGRSDREVCIVLSRVLVGLERVERKRWLGFGGRMMDVVKGPQDSRCRAAQPPTSKQSEAGEDDPRGF